MAEARPDGAVFMVPFAAVTYKMTSSINALGVDFARQEVSGLEYYRPLVVLLRDLQLHRDGANGLLSGETAFADQAHAEARRRGERRQGGG